MSVRRVLREACALIQRAHVAPPAGRPLLAVDKDGMRCEPLSTAAVAWTSVGALYGWPWTGATFSTGYGAFWLGSNNVGAHRVACAMAHGLARGRIVLHSCDNPPCCNPAHLRWGTPAENMDDRSARGRAPIGSRHGRSHLTEDDVLAIRARNASGESLVALGRAFAVTPEAIGRIVRRETWRHV